MKTSYDVVVIGSGFGGAITACRLAQAGHSVCIPVALPGHHSLNRELDCHPLLYVESQRNA